MGWTKSPQSLIDLFDKSVPSSDRRNAGFWVSSELEKSRVMLNQQGGHREDVCSFALRI
jgi:hypothetical protein